MARRPVLEIDGVVYKNVYEVSYILYTAKDETGRPSDRAHAGIIAVKQGAKGALVSDNSEAISCSVIPVTGGDSVGAGDSFDAGFLTGWLRGLSLEDALKIGCACGRSVASQVGGVKGQLTWQEAISGS